MAACGSALSLSRKRPGPVCTDVPSKRRLPENPATPPTARTGYTEVKWTVPQMQLPAPHMQLRHVDDDGDPAIGTSLFDYDGDYGFDNSDVFDQKVAVAVAPPSRLLDRYGAPTLDAEDVLDDAQPPKAFVRSAPLAFHADDESDGEDSDAGSPAARAVRKAEYSSDDDSEEEEEEEDAEYDFSETESAQSRSSDEELDMDGSSSDDDDDDDDDDEEHVFEAWSDGDDE